MSIFSALIVLSALLILFLIIREKRKIKKPECLKYWGVLYFGERGFGKTLEQADQMMKVFKYWVYLWNNYPSVKHGIILTNQLLSEQGKKEAQNILLKAKIPIALEQVYYHFDDGGEMQFCPRKNCWRGKKKHMLHGALIVLDDISTYLPADGWQGTPLWLRKQWTQAQHLGLHFLFNCQVPFAYDVNARRATAICYRFDKLIGSDRPDETAKEIKTIWGVYVKRQIKAKFLWQFGDMEPEQIADFKEAQKMKEKMTGKASPFSKMWASSVHWISNKKSNRYDTLQDVKEYEPKGYIGVKQFDCIDPTHNHTDKKNILIPYSAFKKAEHELV